MELFRADNMTKAFLPKDLCEEKLVKVNDQNTFYFITISNGKNKITF